MLTAYNWKCLHYDAIHRVFIFNFVRGVKTSISICKKEINVWERYILTACLMMKVDANLKLVLRWFFGEVRLRPPASRTPARATRRRDGTLRSLDRVPVPRGDVRWLLTYFEKRCLLWLRPREHPIEIPSVSDFNASSFNRFCNLELAHPKDEDGINGIIILRRITKILRMNKTVACFQNNEIISWIFCEV